MLGEYCPCQQLLAYLQFSYFSMKKSFVGKALLMCTHNMFLFKNQKNFRTFWLKEVTYLELRMSNGQE